MFIAIAVFAWIVLLINNRINTEKTIDPRSGAEPINLPIISIDTNTNLGLFKEGLSANNIEAGLPLWPKTKNTQFQNLAAAESLIQNAKYSRFPMGCIVDIYPFPRDPSNWQLLDQPQYGGTYGRFNLKDWLDYIANSQSEPIITVNTQGRHTYTSCVNGAYFEGTAQDASNMVQFFNKPNDGINPWANLRASLGYPDPIGVKYWQIGNEPYSDNREGGTNFTTLEARVINYAQTVVEFSRAMKQVDPTIKIAAVTFAHRASPGVNGVRTMPPLSPQFYKDQLYSVASFEQSIDMVSTHNEQRGGCDDETAYVHALTRQNERTDTLRSLFPGKMIYFDETSLCTEPKKS